LRAPDCLPTTRRKFVPNAISLFRSNYLNRPAFLFHVLAIAAVVDVALQRDGRPVSAKTLTARHGLPPRYLEAILQSLAREGILKSLRGPRGGYYLAREPHGVTVNDIIRAAGMADAAEDELTSELVVTVVLPALSAAEKECGQALSRISLNDMVRAALNGH
jgi:Rrf2 family transcriptional regulator, iron-sulfur cluster assembly transcription factor